MIFVANLHFRRLITKYGRREVTDRVLIFFAAIFFFACVFYVLRKRVLGPLDPFSLLWCQCYKTFVLCYWLCGQNKPVSIFGWPNMCSWYRCVPLYIKSSTLLPNLQVLDWPEKNLPEMNRLALGMGEVGKQRWLNEKKCMEQYVISVFMRQDGFWNSHLSII